MTRGKSRPGSVPVVAGGTGASHYHAEANRSPGMVTVAASGNAGFVNYWDTEIFASDCSTVEPLDSATVDRRFLFHRLKALEPWIQDSLRRGAAQTHVHARDLKQIQIELPPITEQRRLAQMLDLAVDVVTRQRNLVDGLDSVVAAGFQHFFGDPVVNPSGWPTSTVSAVCELIADCVNKTAPFLQEVTPFKMLRTTNVRNGRIDTDRVRFVTEEVYRQWTRTVAPAAGDVILTREAPVGEVGVLVGDDHVFLGQRLMLYRVNREVMLPSVLALSISDRFVQAQFERTASGSTVKHLKVPTCRSFEIRVPPIARQREYDVRHGEAMVARSIGLRALALGELFLASLSLDPPMR